MPSYCGFHGRGVGVEPLREHPVGDGVARLGTQLPVGRGGPVRQVVGQPAIRVEGADVELFGEVEGVARFGERARRGVAGLGRRGGDDAGEGDAEDHRARCG